MILALQERALAAFERLMLALRPALAETWLEADLTMAQLKTLFLLSTHGRASGRELAQDLGVRPSAISQLVERLVAQGYVQRAEDRADRRITWLSPTERGRAAITRLVTARRERFAAITAALPAEQLHHAAEALEVLAEAAERTGERSAEVAVAPAGPAAGSGAA